MATTRTVPVPDLSPAGMELVKHLAEIAATPLANVTITHPSYKWLNYNAGPLGVFGELQKKKMDAAFQRSIEAGADVEIKTVRECAKHARRGIGGMNGLRFLLPSSCACNRCRSSCTAP